MPPETPFEVWTLRWAGSISNGTLVPCHAGRPEPGGRPPILRRTDRAAHFTREEAPQLVATAAALFPRWSAFILTGLLAGLRGANRRHCAWAT